MLDLHALVPMLPGRGLELFGAAAMAGELRHVHRVPGAGQALSDIAHLDGRAAETMDKEEAQRASGKSNALVGEMHSNSFLSGAWGTHGAVCW